MSRLTSRLQHFPMTNSLFSGERTALVALTQGRVLELCFETAKNLHYYSPWVTDLTVVCLEGPARPSEHDANDRGLRVERIFPGGDATRLPFDDAAFDWVVTTLTLCRMKHPAAMLSEVRRVLKPSGGYLFLEHGRGDDPSMRRRQASWRNLWMRLGECDIDLDIDGFVLAAGMRIERRERHQLGHPRFLSTMYRGLARRD